MAHMGLTTLLESNNKQPNNQQSILRSSYYKIKIYNAHTLISKAMGWTK